MEYFVTSTWLKNNLPVNVNIDDKNIIPLIKSSADMYVRSILGTYFYNDLLTKYNAQSLSADEKTLVNDYIKYAIAWKSASEAAITTSYELKNKGLQTQSGDYSTSPEYKAIMFVTHHYSDKADFYLNRLSIYLKDNKSLYASFTNALNTDSTAKNSCDNNNNNFTNNILFI